MMQFLFPDFSEDISKEQEKDLEKEMGDYDQYALPATDSNEPKKRIFIDIKELFKNELGESTIPELTDNFMATLIKTISGLYVVQYYFTDFIDN